MNLTPENYSIKEAARPAYSYDIDFEVFDIRRVADGNTVIARFDLRYAEILIKGLRLHQRRSGLYLGPPGRKAVWAPGGWEAACELSPELSEQVLDAVVARLEADEVDGAA